MLLNKIMNVHNLIIVVSFENKKNKTRGDNGAGESNATGRSNIIGEDNAIEEATQQ